MKGLIQIYTGDGKGKTTAALGLALRALGWGKKVCIIQFAKGNSCIGEVKFSKKISKLKIYQFGQKKFITKPSKKDKLLAEKGLDFAQKTIKSEKYQIVVLDEINIALYYKLLDLEKVIKIITQKPKELEIILTGRYAKPKLQKIADLVTEMKQIKHPYSKNIKARKGIEY